MATSLVSELCRDFRDLDVATPLTVDLCHNVGDLRLRQCPYFDKNHINTYFMLPTEHVYTFIATIQIQSTST